MTTLEPCDNNADKGYETYGNCQAGTSVALHANVLVLGKFNSFKLSVGCVV